MTGASVWQFSVEPISAAVPRTAVSSATRASVLDAANVGSPPFMTGAARFTNVQFGLDSVIRLFFSDDG